MIKTKFKHITLVLLIAVLSVAIALVAVACKDTTPADNTTTTDDSSSTAKTETPLITNGDFSSFDSGTAPFSPKSGTWSIAKLVSDKDYVAGIVSLNESSYNNTKSAWGNLAYPGNPNTDDEYALMIYNVDAGGIAYRHTSFKTTIGAYYKISVTFRVVAGEKTISDDSGAFIKFYNDANTQFGPFGVTDGWQTVTLYLQSSQSAQNNISFELSMGNADHPTEGYVFFHDVTATKLTALQYADATVTDASKEAKVSLLLSDPDFDMTTDTTSTYPKSPSKWTGAAGEGNGSAPSTTYTKAGIVSTEEEAFATWLDTIGDEKDNPGAPEGKSSTVLGISNDKALSTNGSTTLEGAYTSYGYTAAHAINVEPGSYYLLSVWVYTDLNDPEFIESLFDNEEEEEAQSGDPIDHSKFGANIRLKGQTEVLFKDINTAKTWKQYTFVLLGDDYRAKQLYLSLWLGYGGTEDTTRASGSVYFDGITLQNMGAYGDRATIKAYYEDPGHANQAYTKVVDVRDLDDANLQKGMIANANFDAEEALSGWSSDPLNEVRIEKNVDYKVEVIDVDANEDKGQDWWKEQYSIDASPKAPYGLSPVLMINLIHPGAYEFKSSDTWDILPNLHYRLAVWVKTTNIAEGKGISAYIKDASDDSTVLSLTTLNTASYSNELTNDYVELQFYIKGSDMTAVDGNNTRKVYLDIQFGSGNNYSTSSFLTGQVFIANVNMEQVAYSEYNSVTTGTYIAKSSSSSSTGTVSNGNFNSFSYDESKINLATGVQSDLLKSASFTTETVSNLSSGILNINSAALINSLLGDGYNIYNAWDDSVVTDKPVDFGAPNLFVALTDNYGKEGAKSIKANEILSSSTMSLSTNSYYIFKAYVRAVNAPVEIVLTTDSNNSSPLVYKTKGNGKWEEVVFAIESGLFASSSMKFKVYFGEYYKQEEGGAWVHDSSNADTYSGIAFLDSFAFYSITQAEFEALGAAATESFSVDGFNTLSVDTSKLASANGWSGTPSSPSNVLTGIYSQRYSTGIELPLKEDIESEPEEEGGDPVINTVNIEGKSLTVEQLFDTTGFDGVLGESVLVINNQKASHYQYALSTSLTLAANSYYHISVDAHSFYLEQKQNAIIKLTNDSDFIYSIAFNSDYQQKIENNVYVADTYEEGSHQWQTFHFYVATTSSSISSVKLYLILGETNADVQGDVAFDNVKLEKVNKADFLAQYQLRYKLDAQGNLDLDADGNRQDAANSLSYLRNNRIVRLSDNETKTDETDDGDDDNTNTENNESQGEKNNLLWLYISSIAIAAILIVVIIVFLVRRYAPKRKKKPTPVVSNAAKTIAQPKQQPKDDKFKD